MTEQITGQKNIAMLGDGFYSRVSLGPKAVIDNCRQLMADAVNDILQSPDVDLTTQPFTIADFGAADGGTSLDLIGNTVNQIRTLKPDTSINVVYTDLPGADFGTLFRHVDNQIDGKPGYLHNDEKTHVFCSGLSFYRAILPAGTLHLGFSASAMHYLSSMPATINDHVHAVFASQYEQAEYRAVAREDWQTILLRRSQELASGGRLVMANFCVDDNGYYLGNTGGENMFDNYNILWSGMRDNGIISDGEYRNTAFQQYYKTVEESLAPLKDPKNPVYQSGLTLDSAHTEIVACPFRTSFEQGQLNREQFSRQFVDTHRSWTETTFRAGLDDTRTEAEKQAILDQLYHRFQQLVYASPEGHGKDLLHLYLVAKKER